MDTMMYLLPHMMLKTMRTYPYKIGFIIDDVNYSYHAIYEDSMRMLNDMKKMGLVRFDRVLIQAGNTYLSLISFWAALFCDAVPCIIDSEISDENLMHMINNINPKIIVQHNCVDNKNASYDRDCIPRIHDIPDCHSRCMDNEHMILKNTESDMAMMLYTSGSTGEPKGVMLSHRNVIAAIESINSYLMLSRLDIILSVLPIHFDYGLYQMLLCVYMGATLVLEKNALFPHLIARKITRYQVSVFPLVPILAQIFYYQFKKYHDDFSSVRIATNTGENLSGNHINQIKEMFSYAKIYLMYGLTECKRCSYVPPEVIDKKSESIGIPMQNLDMWIQDEHGNKLGPHTEGDLVVSGPTVMLGYWQNEEATLRKIKCHPSGKCILFTGDRAIMDDDGFFYFKGRSDFIVKYKGAKFNSYEWIKKIHTISGVNRAHVFIHEDNNDKKLIVCVETQKEHIHHDELTLAILSSFPSWQKPDYFYFSENFPSLSNGKLDKKTLENFATHHMNEHSHRVSERAVAEKIATYSTGNPVLECI